MASSTIVEAAAQALAAEAAKKVQKLSAACLNLFLGDCMPVATLSRWTHALTVCSTLPTGCACRDVYDQILVPGLSADDKAGRVAGEKLAIAAAGAGDERKVT